MPENPFIGKDSERATHFLGITQLFNREAVRNPATVAFLPIMIDQVQNSQLTFKDACAFYENPANIEQLKRTNPAGLPIDDKAERGKWPVTMKGAQDGTTRLLKEHHKLTAAYGGNDWATLPAEKREALLAKVSKGRGRAAQEMARRESEMAEQWITRTVMTEINLKDEIFSQEAEVRKYVYELIKKKVKEFYEGHKDNPAVSGATSANE